MKEYERQEKIIFVDYLLGWTSARFTETGIVPAATELLLYFDRHDKRISYEMSRLCVTARSSGQPNYLSIDR